MFINTWRNTHTQASRTAIRIRNKHTHTNDKLYRLCRHLLAVRCASHTKHTRKAHMRICIPYRTASLGCLQRTSDVDIIPCGVRAFTMHFRKAVRDARSYGFFLFDCDGNMYSTHTCAFKLFSQTPQPTRLQPRVCMFVCSCVFVCKQAFVSRDTCI